MDISTGLEAKINTLLNNLQNIQLNGQNAHQQTLDCFNAYELICGEYCKEMGYNLRQEYGISISSGFDNINHGKYSNAYRIMKSNLSSMLGLN